jgi:2,3-bisphosphoglycerate-independent phosphoglycerate mutase
MKKVLLIVRDGWGFTEEVEGNAIAAANTPFDDNLNQKYTPAILGAHGGSVGLPDGFQGSSEVGHMNMGAGRIVIQEVTRINEMLESHKFFKSKQFEVIAKALKDTHTNIHLMGLLQNEGVHAHQQHLFNLLKYFQEKYPNNKAIVHVFADGRDTPPKSLFQFLRDLQEVLSQNPNASIGTLMGRYYSMDRSKNYELTSRAYDAICHAKGTKYSDLNSAVEDLYKNAQTPDNKPMFDEYITPLINEDYDGVKAGDVLINYNYRQDRAIQITKAFCDSDTPIKNRLEYSVNYFGFTQYYDEFNNYLVDSITSGDDELCLVGNEISRHGLEQLRISETQKFRHVTSFFNGKLTTPFKGEEQIEVKGDFDASSFASHPEMNADDITARALPLLKNDFSFVAINYANCDMVGHTGVFESARKACEVVDKNVEEITTEAIKLEYTVMITADHGNSEEMIDKKTKEVKTSHTLNPVKLHVLNNEKYKNLNYKKGVLADIGTLILHFLEIPIPATMNSRNLIL